MRIFPSLHAVAIPAGGEAVPESEKGREQIETGWEHTSSWCEDKRSDDSHAWDNENIPWDPGRSTVLCVWGYWASGPSEWNWSQKTQCERGGSMCAVFDPYDWQCSRKRGEWIIVGHEAQAKSLP